MTIRDIEMNGKEREGIHSKDRKRFERIKVRYIILFLPS